MIEVLLSHRVRSDCLSTWERKTSRELSCVLKKRLWPGQSWNLTSSCNRNLFFRDLWWEILMESLCFFEHGPHGWLGKGNLLVAEEINNVLIVFQWTDFIFFLQFIWHPLTPFIQQRLLKHLLRKQVKVLWFKNTNCRIRQPGFQPGFFLLEFCDLGQVT